MPDPGSLQNLKDIVEPAAIGFWPPAAGVWTILLLLLLWTSVGVFFLWLRWRRNTYRRAGLQELSKIRQKLHENEVPKALQELAGVPATLVLYEAPHRVLKSVEDMAQILGADRCVLIGRELTKLHEETHVCVLGEARAWLKNFRTKLL